LPKSKTVLLIKLLLKTAPKTQFANRQGGVLAASGKLALIVLIVVTPITVPLSKMATPKFARCVTLAQTSVKLTRNVFKVEMIKT
jgi:hypothetical protein